MILAKTSHGAYRELQPVLQLPDISYVLKLQKKQAGGQDEQRSYFGFIVEACRTMNEAFNAYGIKDDMLRKVHVCYDSVTCVKEIDHDINNGPIGVDTHLDFNVITKKFKCMVRCNSYAYYTI